MASSSQIKPAEIAAAFDNEEVRRRFPPILGVQQVADLLGGLSMRTIYHWIAKGRFDGCFRKRGKHHFFWRDRIVDRIFNGPRWE
ncbi:MAG TPA: helix-turn-helix domain-containing protein [Tepidisphaeraceae bacterium]|jgi:hypothetical protein|nr:helix-turn-helix domain-containing protein [Tepidisphaeraceae bacterium]